MRLSAPEVEIDFGLLLAAKERKFPMADPACENSGRRDSNVLNCGFLLLQPAEDRLLVLVEPGLDGESWKWFA